MSIKINLGGWNSVFAVPSKVVDEGLKFADGVKLKVLLFVLRNSGNDITEQDISLATGVSVTDIPEVLDYWVSLGIFARNNDVYTPSARSDDNYFIKDSRAEQVKSTPIPSAVPVPAQPDFIIQPTAQPAQPDFIIQPTVKQAQPDFIVQPTVQAVQPETSVQSAVQTEMPIAEPIKETTDEPKTVAPVFSRPAKPDYVYTAQRLAIDEELKILVEEVQIALGKTLSNSDISSLLMLKDTCGLPLDVILMLVQYCVSIEKGNIRS
ncbi:MAG: DnaD domain protein, partial [Ruminococcus sp.]|nr:DnaD domain protein [Ruminococcus sp.]